MREIPRAVAAPTSCWLLYVLEGPEQTNGSKPRSGRSFPLSSMAVIVLCTTSILNLVPWPSKARNTSSCAWRAAYISDHDSDWRGRFAVDWHIQTYDDFVVVCVSATR